MKHEWCIIDHMNQVIQKLYCYVDETGQDARSNVFIVAAVVGEQEQNEVRQQILKAEQESGIGLSKWSNASQDRRIKFLNHTEKGAWRINVTFAVCC